MDFIYAKDLNNKDRNEAWNNLVEKTKLRIIDANKKGFNHIVLDGSIYDANTKRYLDFEFELEKLLKEYGFRIQPTGYIGGVYQNTKDICW